jgi:hypothetical protein
MSMIFAQAADLFLVNTLKDQNNKAIEIFNGTGATVDLSQYAVKLGSNGGDWSALIPSLWKVVCQIHRVCDRQFFSCG